jgi:signal peptidase I
MDLIKRIVAVPGDKISYINKVLYVNGKPMAQQTIGKAEDDDQGMKWPVIEKSEDLNGVVHHIWVRPDVNISGDFQNITIPAGKYFAMGDNRDNSNDSRFWGFMPEENIIGKAEYVILSWDNNNNTIRWKRVGEKIV